MSILGLGLNPVNYEELYSSIIFGQSRSPGRCVLSGWSRTVEWERVSGGGQDGESTKRKGKKGATGTITFHLALDPSDAVDEFTQWTSFQGILEQSQDKSIAFDVYHPDLTALGITSLVVESIGQMTHDGKGGATVAVTLLEYRPPKPKPAAKPTPKAGAKTNAFAGASTDPNAAAKDELGKLLAKAQAP